MRPRALVGERPMAHATATARGRLGVAGMSSRKRRKSRKSRKRRRRTAAEWLARAETAYTGLCVGMAPDGSESDRDYLDEEMGRLGQKDLSDPLVRRRFRTNLRRRVLRAALDDVARRQLPGRATDRDIRARGDDIRRRLRRAGLLKLVCGSVPFTSAH